jgi:hypothetical protein
LEPSGKVRRVADHRLLLGRALADEIANDHEAGRDTDADFEWLRRPEPSQARDDVEPCSQRALGVVLVGARKAKISQNAVTHELGNEPVISGDRSRTSVLVGADDLTRILGIVPGGKRR